MEMLNNGLEACGDLKNIYVINQLFWKTFLYNDHFKVETELEIFEKDASNHKAHHKIKEHKPVMPDLYIKFHYNMLCYLRSGIIFLSLDPLIADILWTHWDLTYSGHTDI